MEHKSARLWTTEREVFLRSSDGGHILSGLLACFKLQTSEFRNWKSKCNKTKPVRKSSYDLRKFPALSYCYMLVGCLYVTLQVLHRVLNRVCSLPALRFLQS
jgi:hypothetical protein